MTPSAFSLPINAPSETVWALLLDEMTNPERYDTSVSRLRIASSDDKQVSRSLTRAGASWQEQLQANVEALMVEHCCRTGDSVEITIIHQVMPTGPTSLLNLAVTMAPLDKELEISQALMPDLEIRALTFKTIAESLEKTNQ